MEVKRVSRVSKLWHAWLEHWLEAEAQVLLPHCRQQSGVHKPGRPVPVALLLLLLRAARPPVLLHRPWRHATRRWQRQEVAAGAAAAAPRPPRLSLRHDVLICLVGHDVEVAVLTRLGCLECFRVWGRALLPSVLEPALQG